MIFNRQKDLGLSLPAARDYVRKLRRTLRLGRRDFNVCLVNDREIKRLNLVFRGQPRPTDVLAFPWEARAAVGAHVRRNGEFKNFLGDVVISTETARRNARLEGHATALEIQWLIIHGLLHLLGYDHATDNGEMTALEHSLRQRLGTKAPGRKLRWTKKSPAAAGAKGWR